MRGFKNKVNEAINELTRQSILQGVIGEEQEKLYRYGLEHLMISCIYFLSYLAIGVVTKNFKGLFLYLLFFTSLRVFAGGFHMKQRITCYITTISMICAISLLIKNYSGIEMGVIWHFLVVVSYAIIMRFAPLEHKNRRFDKEERQAFRKMSVGILNAETILYILCLWKGWNQTAFILIICLVQEAVLILLGCRGNGGVKNEKVC